jgi:hypothetical protein
VDSQSFTCIEEDADRWAMIVDYVPHEGADVDALFRGLDMAAEEIDVCCRMTPGRGYGAHAALRRPVCASPVKS